MLTEQQEAFSRVLELVEDAGCASHVVLIGSWAEFVYREVGLLSGFSPDIRTRDVDFLVQNLRHPNPPAHLTALAKERGYLVDADRLTGTTKLLDAHSGLEVEFLIGKKGQGLESVLKTNIGVAAQALRHLDILARNRIEVICLGHRVNVPCPEAYAVHKMTVNAERGQKSEKDARAVLGIWPFLNKAKVETLLDGLTKRERLRANEFMQTHQLEI